MVGRGVASITAGNWAAKSPAITAVGVDPVVVAVGDSQEVMIKKRITNTPSGRVPVAPRAIRTQARSVRVSVARETKWLFFQARFKCALAKH